MIPKDYNHTTTANNLNSDDCILVSDSQDIVFWLEYVAFPRKWKKDITGIIVIIGDGDLIAMWLTESARYYDLSAFYHPLSYYRPSYWRKRNLPEYWIESNIEYRR